MHETVVPDFEQIVVSSSKIVVPSLNMGGPGRNIEIGVPVSKTVVLGSNDSCA